MFDHRRYIPIIRWKRGEWVALRYLTEDVRAKMTPVVEITPKSFATRSDGSRPTVSEALSKVAQDLAANWGWRTVFVDLLHLPGNLRADNGLSALAYIVAEARSRGASLIPVTGLARGDDYQEAVAPVAAEGKLGVCVRLFPSDIARPSLESDLSGLVSQLGVGSDQTDLIVDLQSVGDGIPDWARILPSIPRKQSWRTLTVAAGSFPPELTEFSVGEHRVRRADWLGWLQLVRNTGAGQRRPSFADYTIQHGIYREPPRGANVSASIATRWTMPGWSCGAKGFAMKTDLGAPSTMRRRNCFVRGRGCFAGAVTVTGTIIYTKGLSRQTHRATPRPCSAPVSTTT